MPTTLREQFERRGMVRVPGAIGADVLGPMRDSLRTRIENTEFVEVAGALRPVRGTELDMWSVGQEPAFASLPDAFANAVERVFGPGEWTQVEDERGGYFMPHLPCPGVTATECAAAWHVDEPTEPGKQPHHRLLGFAHVGPVVPGGGGTVVLTGSHRRLALLANELGTPTTTDVSLQGLRAADPWVASLLKANDSRLGAEHTSAGIRLRVEEMTGDAGDIVLVNPCCLHTTSANASAFPRLVMRLTCVHA